MVALLLSVMVVTAPMPDSLSRADSLRREAQIITRQADSLKAVWDVLWKRSDSLRIESMLIRMKSNKLYGAAWGKKRAAEKAEEQEKATARALALARAQAGLEDQVRPEAQAESEPLADSEVDADIVDAITERSSLGVTVVKVRSGTVRSGQTLSDSITADVLREESDTGIASYYADAFHGKKTSSGEVYNMNAATCAHRWLPFGTLVRVTNLSNNRSVVVRVTDRGPFHHGRLIDISKGAAKEIDMIRSGTARVAIEVVPDGEDAEDEGALDDDDWRQEDGEEEVSPDK
jgi:rare lipoprotein A